MELQDLPPSMSPQALWSNVNGGKPDADSVVLNIGTSDTSSNEEDEFDEEGKAGSRRWRLSAAPHRTACPNAAAPCLPNSRPVPARGRRRRRRARVPRPPRRLGGADAGARAGAARGAESTAGGGARTGAGRQRQHVHARRPDQLAARLAGAHADLEHGPAPRHRPRALPDVGGHGRGLVAQPRCRRSWPGPARGPGTADAWTTAPRPQSGRGRHRLAARRRLHVVVCAAPTPQLPTAQPAVALQRQPGWRRGSARAGPDLGLGSQPGERDPPRGCGPDSSPSDLHLLPAAELGVGPGGGP